MNIEAINNKYSFLFESAVNGSFTPSEFHKNKMSTTLVLQTDDAFSLNPILSGFLTDCPVGDLIEYKKTNKGVLLRATVGYAMMSKIENDFGLGCLCLSKLINAMMFEAYRYRAHHLDSFKLICFDRPYQKNSYFKEMENNPGFELRLWVEFDNVENKTTQS